MAKKVNDSFIVYLDKIIALKRMLSRDNIINKDKYLEELETIENEVKGKLNTGVGYNYSYEDYIKRLDNIITIVDKESNEFHENKKTALMETLTVLEEKTTLDREAKKNKSVVKNLRVNVIKLASVVAAFVLVPFVTGAIGVGLSSQIFKKFKRNETMHSSKNGNPYKPIGGLNSYYEEGLYHSKVEIRVFGPWIKSNENDGYTRDYYEYKYESRDDVIRIDKVFENVEPVQRTAVKKYLTDDDSTTQNEIVITETTTNFGDSIPQVETMVIFGLIYAVLGLWGIDRLGDVGDKYEELKKAIAKLREANIKKRSIQESYEQIGDKVVRLQTLVNEGPYDVNELLDKITPELLDTVIQQARK